MKLKILGLAVATVLLHGCATHSMQTATAVISKEKAAMIKDGETTKVDILAMFGEPNGFDMSFAGYGMGMGMGASRNMMRQFNRQMKDDFDDTGEREDLMHYKNCVTTSASKAGLLSGNFIIPRSSTTEVCQLFTALLDDNDVVIAHGYVDKNIISKELIDKLQPGDDKRKVVRLLAGPTAIQHSGDKDIWTYKNCISVTALRAFVPFNQNMDTRTSCQQAGLVFNKATGKLTRIMYIPWNKKPI